MAERFSLKDHLFNPDTVRQLGAEFAAGVPDFDAARFTAAALAGFPDRELVARMEWMADCLEEQLAGDFDTLASQLEAALPARLDPSKADDDFGHFIHGVHGILAARHGLETHRARAMAVIYKATQRFSMEFYIRHFLNRWPEETLAELSAWTADENYHVRRLVSEGTRPRLPWARNIGLSPEQTLPLLDMLHADRTRFVTRSVANHLNDLSKIVPDAVLERFSRWETEKRQDTKELRWMKRHSLRSLIKQGHPGAMAALGYEADAPVVVQIVLSADVVPIGGKLAFEVTLSSEVAVPVLVDYRIGYARPSGKISEKVFKLKASEVGANAKLVLKKSHTFKADASTFKLHAGPHIITDQANGRDVARAAFVLVN